MEVYFQLKIMQHVINNFIFGNVWDFGNPFTIVIDTRNTISGGSAENEWKFPQNTDIYDTYINFLIDWGDGEFSRITTKAQAVVPHVYSVPGIYTINMYKPKIGNWILSPRYEGYQSERLKILKVLRWGNFQNSRNCFWNCSNLDLSEVEGSLTFSGNTRNNFAGCVNLTTIKNLSDIYFTNILDFTNIFNSCQNFNQSFTFNAPNATYISAFLYGCTNFNGDLVINAPNITRVDSFFRNCTSFNKPVHNIGFDWTKINNMTNFMTGKSSANYNAAYYDDLLIALDNAGQSNVTLGMDSIKYTSAGATARANLISKGWTITDGGQI